MMTIQEQEQKLIPDKVFPKWARLFDYAVQLQQLGISGEEFERKVTMKMIEYRLNIGSHAYCVVGEAYGFDRDYTWSCSTCKQFASGGVFNTNNERQHLSFVRLFGQVMSGKIPDWRNHPTTLAFTKHYQEKHSK